MPSVQRPVDRTEPPDDDELWTRRFERQSTKVEQDERVCHHTVLLFFPAFSNARLFRRVKCPYCPVESMVSDALRVHF